MWQQDILSFCLLYFTRSDEIEQAHGQNPALNIHLILEKPMCAKHDGFDEHGNPLSRAFDLGGGDEERLRGEKILLYVGYVGHEHFEWYHAQHLNIRGIARSRLAKSTLDVAWGSFLHILSSKAEEAGVTVIAVPPHNTTQVCSRCGTLPSVPKTLADRVHSFAFCGYVADRDVNAAQNILRLGSSLQDRTCADGRSVS